LTPQQGCSTTVAASVLDFDDDVVYLQPYWILPTQIRKLGTSIWTLMLKRNGESSSRPSPPPFPVFEMLGPYVVYTPTTPRLPDDGGIKASQCLFDVCEALTGTTRFDSH
jgi:hypothetical protein